METFGQLMRRLRGQTSLRELARRTYLDSGHLSRVEAGHRRPTPSMAATLDTALNAGGTLVAMAEAVRAGAANASVAGGDRAGGCTDGKGRTRDDLAALRSFRAVDSHIGGGYLYLTVAGYLHHTIVPSLLEDATDRYDSGSAGMLAGAAMTEMVGWMAHDGGRDDLSRRHLHAALGMARGAGDSQLAAHVLGSLSHVAYSSGRPREGVRLTQRGLHTASDLHPGITTWLLALRARGSAVDADLPRCHRDLSQAEQALAGTDLAAKPVWISDFDPASFAMEAARCFYLLGDFTQAQRQAELVLELRPAERARSRSFARLLLAHVLVARGEVDRAAAVGQAALEASRTVGSRLVTRQLARLGRRLATHRRVPAVATFRQRLTEELPDRSWLDQWPPTTTPTPAGRDAS